MINGFQFWVLGFWFVERRVRISQIRKAKTENRKPKTENRKPRIYFLPLSHALAYFQLTYTAW